MKLMEENSDLRDELKQIQKRYEGDVQSLRDKLKGEQDEHGQAQIRNAELLDENGSFHEQLGKLDAQLLKAKAEADELAQNLKLITNKYELQNTINAMYRRFYSRQVLPHMAEDAFDKSLEETFKDFNAALESKDNFITANMNDLELMIDKTSVVRSDSLRQVLFGDLDAVIAQEMKVAKKKKKAEDKAEANRSHAGKDRRSSSKDPKDVKTEPSIESKNSSNSITFLP